MFNSILISYNKGTKSCMYAKLQEKSWRYVSLNYRIICGVMLINVSCKQEKLRFRRCFRILYATGCLMFDNIIFIVKNTMQNR